MIDLTIYALPIIFAVSVVLILVASEIGHYFGLRVAREANISTLEAAMLDLNIVNRGRKQIPATPAPPWFGLSC
jgi:hypothetical protein